jgi:hypothetical protein
VKHSHPGSSSTTPSETRKGKIFDISVSFHTIIYVNSVHSDLEKYSTSWFFDYMSDKALRIEASQQHKPKPFSAGKIIRVQQVIIRKYV